MAESREFRHWLRIELGRVAVTESQLTIPPEEVQIEVKRGGKWTVVQEHDLAP